MGYGLFRDASTIGVTAGSRMILSRQRDGGRTIETWYLFHARETALARYASPWPKEMFSPGTS
jgi:hypothetical protein